jgi:hypothetical protein
MTWIAIAKMELPTVRIEWLQPRWASEVEITLMAHLLTDVAPLKKRKLADLEIDP